MNEAQHEILRMLQNGVISAEEANRLLAVTGDRGEPSSGPARTGEPPIDEPPSPAEAPAEAVEAAPVMAAPPPPGPAESAGRKDDSDRAAHDVDQAAVAAVAASSSEQVRRDLDQDDPPAAGDPPAAEASLAENVPSSDHLRRLWQIPFGVALLVLIASGMGMSAFYNAGGLLSTLGFACAWSVFMLAVFVLGIAYWSRTARWMHVRVRELDGRRIAISLPVPLRLVSWAARFVRPFVDRETAGYLDMAAEFVTAMQDELSEPGASPLLVDVDDDDQQVQVYFG